MVSREQDFNDINGFDHLIDFPNSLIDQLTNQQNAMPYALLATDN